MKALPVATVLILFFCSPAFGPGMGFYVSSGSGDGEWEAEDDFDIDFDVDTSHLQLGFALDTAPASERLFNYRLHAGLTHLESEPDLFFVDEFDLDGVSVSHTFGFGLFRGEVVRLWIGPQLRTAFYYGEQESFDDDDDVFMFEIGGGGAIGANFNLGQRFTLSPEVGYRASYYTGFVEEEVSDDDIDITGDDSGAFVAVSFLFRTGADYRRRDADGDGVADGIDRCVGTRYGAYVDATGCPKDDDGDDVPDGIDKCPETLVGAHVDDTGCPKDDDGDDVPDGIDRCPRTLAGAHVDDTGCPKDDDGDDVPDGIDRCPRTLVGAHVDDTGCPKDDDGDDVPDGIDRCPETVAGTEVDITGCPKAIEEIRPDMREPVVLEGVLFEFDSATLTPGSILILERVARSLLDWPELRVEIGGHTDDRGPDVYNVDLSLRRAEAVRDYLVTSGVDAVRLTVHGYGSIEPVGENRTVEGRSANRRVELEKLE